MRARLKTHPDFIGPELNVDLNDVVRIEMHGQRESKAGWVTAKLTLRTGAQIVDAKMTPEEYDKLIADWEGLA